MRVLILANNDSGLYKFRGELLARLIATGHEVIVSVPNGDYIQQIQQIGCRVIETAISRHGTNPIYDMKLLMNYRSILRQEKPDIVFTYTIKPNVYGGMACAAQKISYAPNITGVGNAIANGGPLQKLVKALYKLGLSRAKTVFFQNEANMTLFKQWGVVRENVQLIPGSGVNLDYHVPVAYPEEETGTRFLFIGRIMKAKGIDELLEAMKLVHAKFPDAFLDIIGGVDGDYHAVMEKTNQLGYVRYHGIQSDVRPFIHKSHCTVLPSYHEGTANVLLESAAAGRPIIATLVPGCQETFEDGITGLGCAVRDANSLADAMIKFIELPYEEKEKMGKLGREKMEREYDRNIVISAYMKVIETCK